MYRRQIGPRITHTGRQGFALGHTAAEDRFLTSQTVHELRIDQRSHTPTTALIGVLDTHNRIHGDKGLFVTLFRIADQTTAQFRRNQLVHRQNHIADGHQLGLRQKTLGRAGIARQEDRLAFGGLVGIPLEVNRRRGRLAVLIDTYKGRIDGKAREGEIVEVTAKSGRPIFRCPCQTHIVIFAELVELELTTAIQADHLTTDRLVGAAGLDLDTSRLGLLGLTVQTFRRLVHTLGYIGNVGQDFSRRAGAL